MSDSVGEISRENAIRDRAPRQSSGRLSDEGLENRRFAAAYHEGEWVLVDSHSALVLPFVLSLNGGNQADAEFAANFMNCHAEIKRGMEVTGLNELMFTSLGEVRIELRTILLQLLSEGFDSNVRTRPAI